MALVILGFAAVALTRSVDTGTLIMGNLSFKQDTLMASNSGAEQAIAWLQANANNSTSTPTYPRGYYASSLDQLDATRQRTTGEGDNWPLIKWDNSCLGLTKPRTKPAKYFLSPARPSQRQSGAIDHHPPVLLGRRGGWHQPCLRPPAERQRPPANAAS